MYLSPSKLVYLRLASFICILICPPLSVWLSLYIDYSDISIKKSKSYSDISNYLVNMLIVITFILTITFYFPGVMMSCIIYYFCFDGSTLMELLREYGPLKPRSYTHSSKYQDLYKEEGDNVSLLLQNDQEEKRSFIKRLIQKHFFPRDTIDIGNIEVINLCCTLLYSTSYLYIGAVIMLGSPIMLVLESESDTSIKRQVGTHFIGQGLGCIFGILLGVMTYVWFLERKLKIQQKTPSGVVFLQQDYISNAESSQASESESEESLEKSYTPPPKNQTSPTMEATKIQQVKKTKSSIYSNPHIQFAIVHTILSLILFLKMAITYYWCTVAFYFVMGVSVGILFLWNNAIQFKLWKDKARIWIYIIHIFLAMGISFPICIYYMGYSIFPYQLEKISFIFHVLMSTCGILLAFLYIFSYLPILSIELSPKEPEPWALEQLTDLCNVGAFQKLLKEDIVKERGWIYLTFTIALFCHFGVLSSVGNLSAWHAKDYTKYTSTSSFLLGLEFWFSFLVGSILSLVIYIITKSPNLIILKCMMGMILSSLILLLWPTSKVSLFVGVTGIGQFSASFLPSAITYSAQGELTPRLFYIVIMLMSVFIGTISIPPLSSKMMQFLGIHGLFLSSTIVISLTTIIVLFIYILNQVCILKNCYSREIKRNQNI